jgi:hypothetical protein
MPFRLGVYDFYPSIEAAYKAAATLERLAAE